MDFLKALSASKGFLPHVYCLLGNRELVWLHVVSDSLITLAYYSIPIALVYFVRKKGELGFKWMFLMFGVFIFACGTTHLIGVWTLWHPVYWLQGVIKAMTAGVSIITAVLLWPLIPKALALPSPETLEAANRELERQIRERESAEEEIRQLNKELEQRVNARTAELETANKELRTQIAERNRAERYQAIQFGVTRILTESATFQEATPKLLQSICEGVGWELGELWRVNPSSKRMCWEGIWHASSLNVGEFETISRETAFSPGSGLPGRVWASGRPAWIPDVGTNGNFLRGTVAANLGLRGAFAFPIENGSGVTGVMAFFSCELRQPDDHLLGMMAELGVKIGQFIERKQAEAALRETNETLTAMIHASPMGITILDTDGNVKLWNPAAERIFGWQQEEVLGHPLPTIPHDKQEEHRAFRERVLRNEASAGIEAIRQKKDGSPIDISLSTAPLRDATGNICGAMGIMEDISERKRAQEGRARLLAIIDATTDFVGVTDEGGRSFYINRAGRKIIGIGPEEDISTNTIRDYHPEWANQIIMNEAIPAAIRDGVWMGETALLTRGGREIPISQVVIAHKAPDGRVEYLSTIARDITDLKQAETTRRALYEASLEIQAPLALQVRLGRLRHAAQTILNLDRVNILFADASDQWLEVVASTESEATSHVARIPIGPEGGALAEAYLTRQMIVWDGRAPVPASLRLSPPYDQIQAFRSQVFAIVPLVVQGRAIGVLGADRKYSRQPLDPITLELLQLFAAQAAIAIEHARLYEAQRMAAIQLEATVEARTRELQQSNGELEAFSYSVSHDLRAPLRAMQGFAQALQEDYADRLDAEGQDYARRIVAGAHRMDALIQDLLTYSRLSRDELPLQPVALTAVLAEVRAHLEAVLEGTAMTVVEPLPVVRGHHSTLVQVVGNLLANAVKFVAPGVTPEIRVWAEAREGVVRLWVQDNGIGIAPEHQARIFRVFERLHGLEAYPGTGIGLAIVRKGVERLGGKVGVESAVGAGSRFWVELPGA